MIDPAAVPAAARTAPSAHRRPHRRWIALSTGAALTVVGVLAVTGTATAAPGATATAASTTATAGPAGRWADLDCADLQRIQSWTQDRITLLGSDAGVRGSTAWVRAELNTATDAGRTVRAARLQKVLDARIAHPDRWQRVLDRVERAESRVCG